MNATTNFQVGQVIKVKGGETGLIISVDRIAKVYKNRIVLEVDTLTNWALDGLAKRRGGGGSIIYRAPSSRILPLEEGETFESVTEEIQKRRLNVQAKEQAKEVQRLAEVIKWWDETGKLMWKNRITIPAPIEGELHIIRYKRHEEEYVVMASVEESKDWRNDVVYKVTASGYLSRQYTSTIDNKEVISLNATSTGIHEGPTLDEALYNLIH